MIKNGYVLVLMALTLLGATATAQQFADHPLLTTTSVRGDGAWKADGRAAKTTQRWDLSMTRKADGSVSGRITVVDSPLLTNGSIEGRLDGRRLSGVILDEGGNRAASFDGSVGADRIMRGTYTDRTGETGEWEWEGQLGD